MAFAPECRSQGQPFNSNAVAEAMASQCGPFFGAEKAVLKNFPRLSLDSVPVLENQVSLL